MVVETARAGTHTFVKWSSLATAKSLRRLSRLDDGAASIDHAGAGRVDGASGGVMRPQPVTPSSTLSMRLLPRGGVAQMSRAHSLARLDCWRCGAAGWAYAHPFTPSTRHVTISGSSPSSAEPRRVPQYQRDRFASACASSSLGPWSDDPSASMGGRDRTIPAARIRSGSTPGSCARALPLFATVARFDPRQAGQTEDHGFPRWPVQKPSFQKK